MGEVGIGEVHVQHALAGELGGTVRAGLTGHVALGEGRTPYCNIPNYGCKRREQSQS